MVTSVIEEGRSHKTISRHLQTTRAWNAPTLMKLPATLDLPTTPGHPAPNYDGCS